MLVSSISNNNVYPRYQNFTGKMPNIRFDVRNIDRFYGSKSSKLVEIMDDYGKTFCERFKKSDGKYYEASTFNVKDKDGKTVPLIVQKSFSKDDSMEQVDIAYRIRMGANRIIGIMKSNLVHKYNDENILHISWMDTENSPLKGVGRYLKALIKEEAECADCTKITLDAAENSHVFHYKTGYRTSFKEVKRAQNILKIIKKSKSIPEMDSLIDRALSNQNCAFNNKVIDECLKLASANGLRSDNLGIKNLTVPMAMEL
jgi:hypothetical protein